MKDGNWTGIQGVRAQDRAVTESMGPVSPRHKEHLGISDTSVAWLRRRLLESVRAFMAGGEPIGLDPSIPHSRLRSEEKVIPIDAPWQSLLDYPESRQLAGVS